MKLVGPKSLRGFLILTAGVMLCLIGLSTLEVFRGLSARVTGCEIDNREAIITVHYKNRLNTAVKASFDLCLISDGPLPSDSNGSAIGNEVKILKRQHVMDVRVEPKEERDQVWRMEIPGSLRLVNASVDRLIYKKAVSFSE